MTVAVKITDWLDLHKVPYEIIVHPKRVSALETAEAEHISGHAVAKAVMIKADEKHLMAVIPADHRIDLFKLGIELATDDLYVEEEWEFRDLFRDCEVGAMPPFGSLYGIPCYVDIALTDNREIVFNAGSHEESIRMAIKDYLLVAEAVIGDFSVPQ